MRRERELLRMSRLAGIRKLKLIQAEGEALRGRRLLVSLEGDQRLRAEEANADLSAWLKQRTEAFQPELCALWSKAAVESARRHELATQLVERAMTEVERRNGAWRVSMALRDDSRRREKAAARDLHEHRQELKLSEQDDRTIGRRRGG